MHSDKNNYTVCYKFLQGKYYDHELSERRSHTLTDFRTNGHGNQHFDQVSRDEWEYAYREGGGYGVSGLHTEPGGSESVADGSSNDHAKKLEPALVKVVDHNTGNDCHRDETDDIAAGGTGQLGNSAGKAGEDRKACETDQQIEKVADGAPLLVQQVKGNINGKVCKGNRYRADGNG